MKKRNLFALLSAVLMMGTACTHEEPNGGNGVEVAATKFVVAATSSEATYLLTMDNLKTGATSIYGNGYEVDNATHWVFYGNKYAYRLVYNQGNAGITTSYVLDEYGEIKERNINHEIQNRFTTHGIYGDQIITAASGATAHTDDAGNSQYGVTITKINVENQTLNTQTFITENMLGTGEYCTLSGIVESNGKIFTAVCPEGVSVYGIANNSHLLSQEALELVNTEGGISGTVNPNQVWVAIYNNSDFENPTIITDNRISYATSRYRSQYYPNIAADDAGNVYVFSSSYSTVQEGIQKTNLPSGVLKINAGGTTFDSDYYVNFEDASVADRAMYRVWHIKDDYFLMQMYTDKGDDKSHTVNTNSLGIFKASSRSFSWVNGLPAADVINSMSRNAYCHDGVAYIGIATTEEGAQPTIYVIDPVTATATTGAVVTSTAISAMGQLTNQ